MLYPQTRTAREAGGARCGTTPRPPLTPGRCPGVCCGPTRVHQAVGGGARAIPWRGQAWRRPTREDCLMLAYGLHGCKPGPPAARCRGKRAGACRARPCEDRPRARALSDPEESGVMAVCPHGEGSMRDPGVRAVPTERSPTALKWRVRRARGRVAVGRPQGARLCQSTRPQQREQRGGREDGGDMS